MSEHSAKTQGQSTNKPESSNRQSIQASLGHNGIASTISNLGNASKTPIDPTTLTPNSILQLQRMIGNQAVLKLVQHTPPATQQEPSFLQQLDNQNDLIQRLPYKLGNKPYGAKNLEKTFTKEEKKWIKDVANTVGIKIILKVYGYKKFPEVILHRVKQIDKSKQTEGQYSPKTDDIAISDAVYKTPEDLVDKQGKKVKATNEEKFKLTLIHELLHYIEQHTKKVDPNKIPTVQAVMDAMLYPTQAGFGKCAFGWFVEPKSKLILHFDVVSFMQIPPNLMPIYTKRKWEKSPMPQSGNSISREEDIASTFALLLTSDRTRVTLQKKYPLRWKLMNRFFGHLIKILKSRKTP